MQLLKHESQARIKENANVSVDLGSKQTKRWDRKAEGQGSCMETSLKEFDQRVKVG